MVANITKMVAVWSLHLFFTYPIGQMDDSFHLPEHIVYLPRTNTQVLMLSPVSYNVMTDIFLCSMQVKREVGDISILVNNAGIVTGKKFMDAPDSLIEKTMEVNIMAHFWVSLT